MADTDASGGGGSHLASFLFDAVERHPNKVAVEEGDGHYTFLELADMVLAIRAGLREALAGTASNASQGASALGEEERPPAHGRRPSEDIVNVVLPRGALAIAAVHAVMLEGKAYNVFDLGNPREVLASQLEIAQPPVVISSTDVAEQFQLAEVLPQHTKLLDAEDELRVVRLRRSLSRPLRPLVADTLVASADRLAYVIFTSGSTGKPKAVMIEHGSACNQVRVFGESYGLEPSDRVCQSISMAFDPHVNEVFGSLRWGCTLVVMSDVVKRSGPDMLPWIAEERVSVLTMTPSGYRMMMSADADVSRHGLPDLRICGSGGEALSREVLDSWAPGRRFFNLYGPTETTVTSVMTELRQGEPIVIGRSLASYENVVLNAATLAPVPHGEQGVLFTGGLGVARGYLNDEAKTRERFLEVPGLGRAYNTGDVVSQDEDGSFHWIGRADFQAKVRGNRIELEYLEHAIMEVHGVTHCEARVVSGGERLVLLASGSDLEESELREVASKLGRAYELSAVQVVDAGAWSFSVNGKLLRNTVALEEAQAPLQEASPQGSRVMKRLSDRDLGAMGTVAIAIELARSIGVALRSPDDDFFSSGGTSVTAATLVSRLRQLGKQHEALLRLKSAAVRDIYECRTMGKLADLLDSTTASRAMSHGRSVKTNLSVPDGRSVSTRSLQDKEVVGTERFYLVSLLQVLWILMEMGCLFMGVIKLVFLLHALKMPRGTKYVMAVLLIFGLLPLTTFVQSLSILLFKRVTCFDPRNQRRIRLWSLHYFRWWAIHHMQDLIPTMLIAGTPFATHWARMMGAKIGRGVVLWTVPKNADLELLEIGDGVSVGQESYFNTTHAERGVLYLGTIKVLEGASLGCRVNVAKNSVVDARAVVEDLTHVSGVFRAKPAQDPEAAAAARAPADVEEGGSGAAGEQSPPPEEEPRLASFGFCNSLAMLPAMGVMLSLYSFVLPVFFVSWIMPSISVHLMSLPMTAMFLIGLVIQVVLVQVLSFITVVVLKWLLIGRIRPGTFQLASFKYWRFWFMQSLVLFASSWLPLTNMTAYSALLLKLLGARVGSKAEFGAFTFGYTPDTLKLGNGVFLADRCSVGAVTIRDGVCEIKETTIRDRSFVGNLAVVKAGSDIKEDVLVGVMSKVPENPERGTSWLGVPPIQLPDRVADKSRATERFGYSPPCAVFAAKLVFDFLRAQVPGLAIFALFFTFNLGPLLFMTKYAFEEQPGLEEFITRDAERHHMAWFWYWMGVMQPYSERLPHPWHFWLSVAAWGVLCLLFVVTIVVVVKWLAMCRIRPGNHALYSYRVASVGLNLALQTVTYPILQMTMGTPLMGVYLRCLGARVGRRAFINTIFVVGEPDLLTLGDNVCLNRMANLSTHTFEDRIMKLDHVAMEDDSAVGCESVVLRGAALRESAIVEDSTLCLVGEELLRGRHRGCPSSRCA